MTGRKTATRDKILDTLSRRGPCTAAELARGLRITPMAVRQHLAALAGEGFVGPAAIRPSRGRPARAFALTPAARGCFPDRSGALALEVLLEVEATAGREAVVQALERRGRRTAEIYRAAVAGKSVAEGLRILASLRDAEGYLSDACAGGADAGARGKRKPKGRRRGAAPECGDAPAGDAGAAAPDLVERHCPVSSVAERFPEVCRIEREVFSAALGVPLERVEHMLSGDGCCRYRVDGEPGSEV